MRKEGSETIRTGSRTRMLAGCLTWLCVGLMAGSMHAQTPPPEPEPDSKPQAATESTPEVKAPPGDPGSGVAGEKSDDTADDKVGDPADAVEPNNAQSKPSTPRDRVAARQGPPAPFAMDPNAKWACDRPIATVDTVWRGEKSLTFTFHIRNEGTADLKIRAKGG